MKLLGWGLAVLLAVWLAAFVGIKIYDLDCIANPSGCFAEAGIWLRKLVLLEWVSKWQTLIAGALAVTGGLATIWSAKITLSAQQEFAKAREHAQLIADISYVAELFRRLSLIGPGKQLEDELSRWDNVPDRVLTFTSFSPKLSIDILSALNIARKTASNGGPTALGIVVITTVSLILSSILQNILTTINNNQYVRDPLLIKSDSDLVASMQTRLLLLQIEQPNATIQSLISLSSPISDYVDFTGTILDPRFKPPSP